MVMPMIGRKEILDWCVRIAIASYQLLKEEIKETVEGNIQLLRR